MTVESQFPAQLIAMVTPETKAEIRAEADERKVSISQVVREHLERGKHRRWVEGAVAAADNQILHGAGHIAFPGHDSDPDDNSSTLRDHIAGLTPDQDGDDVDDHLAVSRADGQPNLRVAPRRPRGLI